MKRWLPLVSMVAFLLVGIPMIAAQENPPPEIDLVLRDLQQRVGTPVTISDLQTLTWHAQGFNDSSLGCPQPGQMYLQVALRGYQVTVSYADKTYDYRVARGGGVVLCAVTEGIATPEAVSTEETPAQLISYENVSFSINSALGVSDVSSETIPASEQNSNHPFSMPKSIQFTFASLLGNDQPRFLPWITIFPVSEYEAVTGDSAVESVNLLHVLLDNRPKLDEQTTLPYPPLTNVAQQDFPSTAHYIDFDGGAGIGYLWAWNGEFFYEFEGLTNDDNQSYVSARFPISTDTQIGDRPNGTLIDEQVNALKPSDFTPNLTLLDDLFRSLSIGETVSWDEAQILILGGQVQAVMQLHSLEVRLFLKDGRQVKTIEPNFDDIISLIRECGANCASIIVRSE